MSANERFKLIAAVYIILRKEEQVLLLRRKNTGFEDGNYGLVAGHVDGGESLTQAIIREAREEVGIELEATAVRLVHVMHRLGNDERLDFFFTAHTWLGNPTSLEPDKCDDLSWFPLSQLLGNTIPYIRHVLEQYQIGSYYSEFGWPVEIK